MTLPVTHWHTVAELNDLVAALDYQVQRIGKAAACASANVAWVTGADAQTWLGDYNDATAAWNVAVADARKLVSLTPQAAWDVTPGEGEFAQLVEAFAPFDDLDRRARMPALGFPASCLPTYPSVPQPKASDLELSLYLAADAAAKAVQKVPQFFGTPGFKLTMGALIALCAVVLVVEVKR